MELIDKAAVVAEIERMFNEVKESTRESDTGTFYAMKHLRSFLDTFEMKEVDLDKSLTDFMSRYAYENSGEYPSAIDIAKHFFELGIQQSNYNKNEEKS